LTILNLAGRTLAMVIGILGAIVAFIITILNFTVKLFTVGFGNAHTPTGIAMSIIALIGALIAIPFPTVSAVLMVIAGIVMLFVAGGWGILPLIILAIAAIFAFLDRHHARRARV